MAGKVITNPTGAFGVTGGDQTGYQQTATFTVSTAAVTAKQVVQIDPSGTAVRTATTTPNALQLGIAMQNGNVGQAINVCIQGLVGSVPLTGANPAAGDQLIQSATTAGKVAVSNTPGLGQTVGMAVGAGSGANGIVDVWVGPKYLS